MPTDAQSTVHVHPTLLYMYNIRINFVVPCSCTLKPRYVLCARPETHVTYAVNHSWWRFSQNLLFLYHRRSLSRANGVNRLARIFPSHLSLSLTICSSTPNILVSSLMTSFLHWPISPASVSLYFHFTHLLDCVVIIRFLPTHSNHRNPFAFIFPAMFVTPHIHFRILISATLNWFYVLFLIESINHRWSYSGGSYKIWIITIIKQFNKRKNNVLSMIDNNYIDTSKHILPIVLKRFVSPVVHLHGRQHHRPYYFIVV